MSLGKNPLPLQQPDSVLQPKLQRASYLPQKVTIKIGWAFILKRKRKDYFWCSPFSLRGPGKMGKILWKLIRWGGGEGGGRVCGYCLILQLKCSDPGPSFICEVERDRVRSLLWTLNLQAIPPAPTHSCAITSPGTVDIPKTVVYTLCPQNWKPAGVTFKWKQGTVKITLPTRLVSAVGSGTWDGSFHVLQPLPRGWHRRARLHVAVRMGSTECLLRHDRWFNLHPVNEIWLDYR